MNSSNSTLEKKYEHQVTSIQCFPNETIYNTFLNWLSGEFELNLQEEKRGLQVYFPTGWFHIKKTESNTNFIQFQILIESKSKQGISKINDQIKAVFEHVLQLKK